MESSIKKGGIPRAILAIAMTGLLMAAACAGTPAQPVEQKVVEIADIAPLTGPSASAEQLVLQGMQDYVTYFNDEIGIPDVTVKLLWADVGFDVPKFISAYRRFSDRGLPILFSDVTAPLEALKPVFEEDEMPFIAATTTSTLIHPPGWIYCTMPTFGEVATAVLDYFMENWTEERPARVAFIGPDSSFGRAPSEECVEYANSIGMEVLPWEFAGYVVIDATPQLLRMKDQGVDLVYIQDIVSAAGPILRDAERLGLSDEMQFGGIEFNLGNTLIEMAGPASEGYLAPRTTPWFDETDIPGIKILVETQEKLHGKVKSDPEYMGGWLAGAIMCEAVNRGIDAVGYENLDGPALKNALDNMSNFDAGIAIVSYSPEQRRASRMVATYQIKNGKIVRVSDWHESPMLVS